MKKVILAILTMATALGAQEVERQFKSVRAVPTETPLIDGVFHDGEWDLGGRATDFIQREPKEGVPASQNTEAYFLYDKEHLYVGVKCYDEADEVMSEIAGRDNIGGSDYFEIMLDTFDDDRNAYSFGTTPDGTKIDGRYSNGGEWDRSWDGVWFVETSRTEWGWAAEFKIPFNTLIFPRTESMTWGLNMQRVIERHKEDTYWQEVTRDEGFQVANFGFLKDISGIEPGRNLQFLPYLTSRVTQGRTEDLAVRNNNGFTGLDMRMGVTSNLTAVLTVNPDFAQIEADEDRINLSRYAYILREKRPFFLEGASIFNTAGNSMSDGEYRTALFYSRRINEPVYGLKMTGKAGDWDVGVIHALNDNDMGIQDKIEDEELPENTRARAFYSVVRMSRDVFSRSQVGLIAMSKEYQGGYNRIVGMDTRIRLKHNFNVSIEGVKSFTRGHGRDNHSMNLYLGHHSDFFKFSLWYQEQASHFIGDEIGFYEYNNFRNVGVWFQLRPRIEKFGIRMMGNNFNGGLENFENERLMTRATLTRWWNYNFWVQTMGYWMFGAGRADGRLYDRFDEVLYPSVSYWAWMQNNWSKPFNFSLNYSEGEYRTGYSWSYSGTVRIKPSGRFNLQFSYNRSDVEHVWNEDDEVFENRRYEIWRSKIYYHFSRNLNARVILQYNGMESRLDMYYLLAYNFKPGSFLYVAYTERFDSDSYEGGDGMEIYPRFGSSYKVFQIKLSYMLQR